MDLSMDNNLIKFHLTFPHVIYGTVLQDSSADVIENIMSRYATMLQCINT